MNNIIHKIRQIYPVSEEALQALLMNMQVRHYPKGTYIVQAGVTDRLVYFIEEGVTRSVFHHDGQDTTTWFSQEGDVTFGMDSLYYQQPSVESIETLSDCKIYVIHIDKLNALYETYIDIANWGRILHQNVNKELSHMFVERLQLPPKERYEQFNRRYPRLINRVKLNMWQPSWVFPSILSAGYAQNRRLPFFFAFKQKNFASHGVSLRSENINQTTEKNRCRTFHLLPFQTPKHIMTFSTGSVA